MLKQMQAIRIELNKDMKDHLKDHLVSASLRLTTGINNIRNDMESDRRPTTVIMSLFVFKCALAQSMFSMSTREGVHKWPLGVCTFWVGPCRHQGTHRSGDTPSFSMIDVAMERSRLDNYIAPGYT